MSTYHYVSVLYEESVEKLTPDQP